MAKVVRWMGAFGKGESLDAAVRFEMSHQREVACEPLMRGRTCLHAGIGLVVDPAGSRFVCGWLRDAWTEIQPDGIRLRARYTPHERGGRKYRDWDRFSALLAKCYGNRGDHAEAIFDMPRYTAVAVRANVSPATRAAAEKLAEELNLQLEEIPMV